MTTCAAFTHGAGMELVVDLTSYSVETSRCAGEPRGPAATTPPMLPSSVDYLVSCCQRTALTFLATNTTAGCRGCRCVLCERHRPPRGEREHLSGAHLTDRLLTSRSVSGFAIEPACRADPMKRVLSAQVPGPSRIPGWFEEVASAASKLSSMPTPAGSLQSSWVWFRTGTLLTL
jgi:hypothetical protein